MWQSGSRRLTLIMYMGQVLVAERLELILVLYELAEPSESEIDISVGY